METTITRKGQITIPKHIRDTLHLAPGSKLVFVGHGTPRKCKIGMRVISPYSCKIDQWYHSRIWPEQIELSVFQSLFGQFRSAPSTC